MQHHFYRIRDRGLLDAINAVLVAHVRVADGREGEPTAVIIDSQSVMTTEAGGPRGYDAGKKIKPVLSDCRRQAVEGGRKRHIATDTAGNLLDTLVHPADIQDRDGAPDLSSAAGMHVPRSPASSPMAAMPARSWKPPSRTSTNRHRDHPALRCPTLRRRGALRRELAACLRTGRTLRTPRARVGLRGENFVSSNIMISQRPAEADDRAAPGHWEGDLILGLGSSAIGTLVERTKRFTMLLHLPCMEWHGGPSIKTGRRRRHTARKWCATRSRAPSPPCPRGTCYDNAIVETFFKTIKSERAWRSAFYTRAQAEQAIARYINGFYNPIRRYSALDHVSHTQLERTASR